LVTEQKMGILHLETNNHASFASLIWGGSASAPCDLHLITEDGMIEAHCGMLFPLSRYLAAIESLPNTAGPIQVVLTETSLRAVSAVKDLVYTGTCDLDKLTLPEILETLAVLGMEVSSDNSFQTEFIDDEKNASNHPRDFGDVEEAADTHEESSDVQVSVKQELEFADIGDPLIIKEETEDGVDEFEGITVGKAFHQVESSLSTSCKENWQNMGKINKDVQVKIPKLKMGQKPMKEKLRCNQCLKKFSRADKLKRHIKNVHNKEQPYQCDQCLKKFSRSSGLKQHIQIVHKKEKPHACPQQGCAQKFGMKIDLKRHMMKVHNYEKPYSCIEQNCDKNFVVLQELDDHLRSAHGAAKLVCGVQNCDATYTHYASLSSHKRRQHPDN